MQVIKIKFLNKTITIDFYVLYSQNKKYKNFRNIRIYTFIDKIYKVCYIFLTE